MFNTNFKNVQECLKSNNMTEVELVAHLKRYLDNQNYRTNYNNNKNKLNQMLKNDPVVKQRFEELKKVSAK